MSKSSQKFIARNRAPRVQIEYDVELYGAEKSIQLPFVMGVMADLSGKSEAPLPAVADRKFLEIDVDNFDDRMRSIKPRAAFSVPNTLTGEGNIAVDLTFERMDDFSPAAIAAKVAPLEKLLQARTRLEHLRTYMDGKSDAEELIARLIKDADAMNALAGPVAETGQTENRLNALRISAHHLQSAASNGPDQAQQDPSPTSAAGMDHTDPAVADMTRTGAGVASDGVDDIDFEPQSGVLQTEADLGSAASDGADDQAIADILAEDLDGTGTDEIVGPSASDTDTAPEETAQDTVAAECADLDIEAADHTETLPEDTAPNAAAIDSDVPELGDMAPEASDVSPHGRLDLPKPEDRDAARPKFRIAILGDFTGRAARGVLEIGPDLARRRPIRFDIDTLDEVIAQFATTLVLPIGADGAGVQVELASLDDLHPDELYDSVPMFAALSDLRQRLKAGDTGDIAQMQDWAALFGDLGQVPRGRARGASVPADLKLSAFQTLIGDTDNTLRTAAPADELVRRIVGPFVQAAPEPDQPAMLAAVDAALSAAMRAVLHHPDFQAVESTWRALELLARRITTGAGLEIVLYDVSAEEWAADLAGQEDLAQTGLFGMLAEEPRLDAAQGPLSAVFGLYTLEETPPHADLMARMAKISDWMNAPFLAAISETFLETPKHERHPLVARSWDALRAMPEACHVGLAAPRFLLRLPYGAKTEPVDPFEFEEFTLRDGLKGMLWANPVVLSAILMCETVNQKGKAMKLGDVMSVGDLPFHYVTDAHGDQVALPCTGRLLTTRTLSEVVARGYIPLVSMKGRNEVRQGSFQGLGAGMLAGPWGQSAGAGPRAGGVGSALDVTRNAPDRPEAGGDFGPSRPGGAGEDYDEKYATETEDEDTDDLDLGLDDDGGLDGLDLDAGDDSDDLDALLGGDTDAGDSDDLDALLAGFADDAGSGDDEDDEMDPELAALMEGL